MQTTTHFARGVGLPFRHTMLTCFDPRPMHA